MAFVGNQELHAELNRLAEGGATYPAHDRFLSLDGAANKWAGTTGHSMLKALNVKAGSDGLEIDGVCNRLAGTTGWSAQVALQQVIAGNFLTLDQASFETSAAGWTAGTNTTVARTTAQAADGAASLSLTATGIGATSVTSPNIVGIIAGQTYTVMLSNRAATTGRTHRLSAVWKNAAGGTISTVEAATGTDSAISWTNSVSAALTAPALATQVALLAEITDVLQLTDEVHYIDKAGVFFGTRTVWVSP